MIPAFSIDYLYSTLVDAMAWCRQSASYYLNKCWPKSRIIWRHWAQTRIWHDDKFTLWLPSDADSYLQNRQLFDTGNVPDGRFDTKSWYSLQPLRAITDIYPSKITVSTRYSFSIKSDNNLCSMKKRLVSPLDRFLLDALSVASNDFRCLRHILEVPSQQEGACNIPASSFGLVGSIEKSLLTNIGFKRFLISVTYATSFLIDCTLSAIYRKTSLATFNSVQNML